MNQTRLGSFIEAWINVAIGFGINWCAMHARCKNERLKSYRNYGGRGISVCEQWADFAAFLADMGERPVGRSIDRYPNNDGNYEPGNCRWATPSEQRRNQRVRAAAEVGKAMPCQP